MAKQRQINLYQGRSREFLMETVRGHDSGTIDNLKVFIKGKSEDKSLSCIWSTIQSIVTPKLTEQNFVFFIS